MKRGFGLVLAFVIAALAPSPAAGQTREYVEWARAGKDCAKVRAFLNAYPQSAYAEGARRVLRQQNCPDPEQARIDQERREAAEQARQEQARQAAQAQRRARAAAEADRGRYGLALLHPQVRAAVIEARAAEQRGIAAAEEGQDAARLAEAAAARARAAGQHSLGMVEGVKTYNTAAGGSGRYEGQFSGDVRVGYGVWEVTSGKAMGNVYSGQWYGGLSHNYGVQVYGENEANNEGWLRYEGAWVRDRANGFGRFFWRNGDVFAGESRQGVSSGGGVLRRKDGQRWEGVWAADRQEGPGVRWDPQGRVTQQGIWRAGELVTPLAP